MRLPGQPWVLAISLEIGIYQVESELQYVIGRPGTLSFLGQMYCGTATWLSGKGQYLVDREIQCCQ